MKAWLKKKAAQWLGASWVLMYHRIGDPAVDPWDLAVGAETFDRQLQWLKNHRTVLPVGELIGRWKAGTLPRRSVALSFDDGYLDNYTQALPLLEKHGLPASFFICTGPLESREGFWWDRLQQLTLESHIPDDFVFDLAGEPIPAPKGTAEDAALNRQWRYPAPPPTPGARVYLQLWERLRMLDHRTRAELLQGWERQMGVVVGPAHVVSREQLQQLARHPLITIGAHTVTHPALQYLDATAQEQEMRASKQTLEGITGQAVPLLAYPYGSYGTETFGLARSSGFEAAFTTQTVSVNKAHSAWSIGRMMVTNRTVFGNEI